MREIKFRAWEADEKCWIPAELVALTSEGKLLTRNSVDQPLGEEIIPVVVVQYTGLRDKNGTEIYEGDVVTDGRYSYEIRWSDQAPAFEAALVGSSLFNWLSDDMSECEVIGNIYENADLIANTVSE